MSRIHLAMREAGDIEIKLDLITLFAFIGHAQLGMRYPANRGPAWERGHRALEALVEQLEADERVPQIVTDHLRLGFDPENDTWP